MTWTSSVLEWSLLLGETHGRTGLIEEEVSLTECHGPVQELKPAIHDAPLTPNHARNPRGPTESLQEVRQADAKEVVPAARKEEEFCKAMGISRVT